MSINEKISKDDQTKSTCTQCALIVALKSKLPLTVKSKENVFKWTCPARQLNGVRFGRQSLRGYEDSYSKLAADKTGRSERHPTQPPSTFPSNLNIRCPSAALTLTQNAALSLILAKKMIGNFFIFVAKRSANLDSPNRSQANGSGEGKNGRKESSSEGDSRSERSPANTNCKSTKKRRRNKPEFCSPSNSLKASFQETKTIDLGSKRSGRIGNWEISEKCINLTWCHSLANVWAVTHAAAQDVEQKIRKLVTKSKLEQDFTDRC